MAQDFQPGPLALLLGAAIRQARQAQGLRLVDLSLISGASLASLSNLETAGRDTRLSTYDKVLEALGLSIEDLLSQRLSAADGAGSGTFGESPSL